MGGVGEEGWDEWVGRGGVDVSGVGEGWGGWGEVGWVDGGGGGVGWVGRGVAGRVREESALFLQGTAEPVQSSLQGDVYGDQGEGQQSTRLCKNTQKGIIIIGSTGRQDSTKSSFGGAAMGS